ncbi:hypothetical protein OOT46_29195 [Aquabacterium sp. A7-Y]|uniref:DUF6950 family protein n=1 Tax=Aquabacterium sp. A7-Y TaxID=1349605 RepID=UPI00223E5564|nr:hypothetical protein [Aquabacterium sp. A7-Y]MCW7541878.1 hypothetical protein [Aquabacterium sp. A7-Y]
MTLVRFGDWPERWARLVAARLRVPFEWGRHDCALWAADVVHALTGFDPGADLRGTYASALQAARVVRARGGLAAIATAALGPPCPPLGVRVGDIGLVRSGDRECYAACNGAHWLAPAQNGLQVVDLDQASACWRVG